MRAFFILVTVLTFLIVSDVSAQTGVSINDDGTAPDAQSLLDLNVNVPSGANRLKGVLLPRMSTTDRDHATYGVNPGAGDVGLMIYNTTSSTYQYWDGSMWVDVGTGTGNASTLDEAYDGGGSGSGRTIDADAGNVEIQGAGHLTVAANVGVGTTTPAAKLEVQFSGAGGILLDGDDSGDARIQFENGGGMHSIFDDQSDNNNLKIESASGRSIGFNTDGANERMVVQSDGRLRVNNLADPSGAVITSNPTGVLGKTPLTAGTNDVLIGTGVFTDANNLSISAAGGWTDDGAVIRLTTIGDNVGIGTTSPANRLSVNGSNSDVVPILGLRSGNDNNGFNNGAQIAFGYNGTGSYQHFVQTRHNSANSQNAIDFYVSDGTQNNSVTSGSTHVMSLVSGSVGIGTTAPASQLHTTGTVRFANYSNGILGVDGSGNLQTRAITVSGTGVSINNGNAVSGNPTLSLNFGNSSTGGTYPQGNFGQFETHGTYGDFNTNPNYWGWNYVQGNTNAPNGTSSQWYRGVFSLGSQYPARGSGGYSLELAFPRYNHSSAGVWMRTVENGSIGGWTRIDGNNFTGNGTTNYLARWTSSTNLGTGATYDNGTNVGIGTTSPGEKLQVAGGIRVADGASINSTGDDLRLMQGVRADDNSYEWVGFYSGNTRQGIILYDGSWSGANSSTDEFSITAENGNKLTLNTNGDDIALMPDGSGQVGVGTINPDSKLHVAGIGSGDGILIGDYNDRFGWDGNSSNIPYMAIRFTGYRDVVNNFTGAMITGTRTNLCCSGLSQGMELDFWVQPSTATVSGDGNLQIAATAFGGGMAAWDYFYYSDQRLKSNVQPISYGLSEVLELKPATYQQDKLRSLRANDKREVVETEQSFGFIAQDVVKVIPELVNIPQDEDAFWSVSYGKLTPVLVKAIQEQHKIIEAGRKERDELKEMILQLQKVVDELKK